MADDSNDVTTLLERAVAGDRQAHDELYPKVEPWLRELAVRCLRREFAENLVNATHLLDTVYRRMTETGHFQWENRGHFYTYARTCIRNVLIDSLRKRKPQYLDAAQLEERVAKSERGRAPDLEFLDLFAEFPEDTREIIWLRLVEGCTFEQTAKKIGLSKTTVHDKWRFALSVIRSKLGNDHEAE